MKILDCNQIKIFINLEIIGEKDKDKDIYMGGKKPVSPRRCLHWAKGPVQRKAPPRPWGESSSAWVWPRIKEATCSW